MAAPVIHLAMFAALKLRRKCTDELVACGGALGLVESNNPAELHGQQKRIYIRP